MVSMATPTTISTEVPPSARAVAVLGEEPGLPAVAGLADAAEPAAAAAIQVLSRAAGSDPVFAVSLVVAAATARRIRELDPDEVTLVPSRPDHPEDPACVAYLKALLEEQPANLEALLTPLRSSDRYRELMAGTTPGFPASDLTLALDADRFDFPLPVERGPHGYLRVRRSR